MVDTFELAATSDEWLATEPSSLAVLKMHEELIGAYGAAHEVSQVPADAVVTSANTNPLLPPTLKGLVGEQGLNALGPTFQREVLRAMCSLAEERGTNEVVLSMREVALVFIARHDIQFDVRGMLDIPPRVIETPAGLWLVPDVPQILLNVGGYAAAFAAAYGAVRTTMASRYDIFEHPGSPFTVPHL
ncbi:MAG TPA: hypothetical protein VLE99_02800 [Candidatus Saccharimonadales bacterium]|nr:hypothetical protein [Candidatus Saccharimonadales bacterium]